MVETRVDRRLAAILAADLVAYIRPAMLGDARANNLFAEYFEA